MRSLIAAGALLIIAAGWPMDAHDPRRTGQSDVRGPRSAALAASITLPNEQALNMPVTVANDGTVFGGSWGVVRSGGLSDRTQWQKFDGKLFAFDRRLKPRWTQTLDLVPYCYSYGSRAQTPDFCPAGGTLNGYNGTVEGVAALDESRGRIYAGRGDGKLYAIDIAPGAIAWRFSTFNANDRNDPEGGGEVIAGPLIGNDGTIYIATAAAGAYETNAIYAITPQGTLRWRFASSLVIWAAPALSPDGNTLYVGGGWGPAVDQWDTSRPGLVYALHANDGTLKWSFAPVNESVWWKPTVWTEKLAVGADGTIYAGGTEYTLGGGSAVLFALRDLGDHAAYAWPAMIDVDYNRAPICDGLALREINGATTRVYSTSGKPYSVLHQGYDPGGKMVAVDASSGTLLWTFDPEKNGGTGAMSGIAIDSDGVIYTGVSGAKDSGRVYAMNADGSLLWQATLGGLLEWGHPVLGPAGDLYVTDTRRCLLNGFPIENGFCNAVNMNPRIYDFGGSDARRRAMRH